MVKYADWVACGFVALLTVAILPPTKCLSGVCWRKDVQDGELADNAQFNSPSAPLFEEGQPVKRKIVFYGVGNEYAKQ